jgi:hypothetical protein
MVERQHAHRVGSRLIYLVGMVKIIYIIFNLNDE